jgi:hypothetical protein
MNRQNKKCKRKFSQIEHLQESITQYTEKRVNIVTHSHSDKSKQYHITLNDDVELCCNCGISYDDPDRKNCRHISLLLLQLYSNYANSMNSKKMGKIETELQDLVNRFNNLLN